MELYPKQLYSDIPGTIPNYEDGHIEREVMADEGPWMEFERHGSPLEDYRQMIQFRYGIGSKAICKTDSTSIPPLHELPQVARPDQNKVDMSFVRMKTNEQP